MWGRCCAESFSSVWNRHSCFRFTKEETELTLSQSPGSKAAEWQSWAWNPKYGTLDSVHFNLRSRCLVTDQGEPVLPTEHLSHPPLPICPLSASPLWAVSPHPSGGILVVSLTQNFLSPSNLRASARLTFLKCHFLCVPPRPPPMTDCQFLLFPTTLGSITSALSSYSSQMGPPGSFYTFSTTPT